MIIMYCLFRKRMAPKELKRFKHSNSADSQRFNPADPKTAGRHGPLTKVSSGQQQFLVLFNSTAVRATLQQEIQFGPNPLTTDW